MDFIFLMVFNLEMIQIKNEKKKKKNQIFFYKKRRLNL